MDAWWTSESFVAAATAMSQLEISRMLRRRAAVYRSALLGVKDIPEFVVGHRCSGVEMKYVLEDVLKDLQDIAARRDAPEVVVHAQIHLLKQYATCCLYWRRLFESAELGLAVNALLRSISIELPTVNVHKLMFIIELLEVTVPCSFFFRDYEGFCVYHLRICQNGSYDDPLFRKVVLDTTVRVLLAHIHSTEEERGLCVVALSHLVKVVEVHAPSYSRTCCRWV
jgi:hypothetical protein